MRKFIVLITSLLLIACAKDPLIGVWTGTETITADEVTHGVAKQERGLTLSANGRYIGWKLRSYGPQAAPPLTGCEIQNTFTGVWSTTKTGDSDLLILASGAAFEDVICQGASSTISLSTQPTLSYYWKLNSMDSLTITNGANPPMRFDRTNEQP
jgi:hypothetical protein